MTLKADTDKKPIYDGNGQVIGQTIDKSQAAPTKVMEANGVLIIVPASVNSLPIAR